MLSIKLAFRNLLGAGLRTWLNVIVLSMAFVVIIFQNGLIDGWNEEARNDTINWETGSGQLWLPGYDRYDPLSLQDAHAPISSNIKDLIAKNELTPILITSAAIYPNGRMQNIIIKGIDPNQKILKFPSSLLSNDKEEIPALIGKRMAESAKLKAGEAVLVRWRDKNGTFDARQVKIENIFDSNVSSIDNGQIWIPLNKLQQLTGMTGEATILIAGEKYKGGDIIDSSTGTVWKFKDLKFLLHELDAVIQSKKGSGLILYGLLLAIALLAIFDTQVLSIFRRQKEIGTYIALGMTRSQVIRLFTVEGSAHSILAILVGALYGIPLFAYLHKTGLAMPQAAQNMGITVAEKIIPVYSAGLILSTTLLVVISSTIVSFFPTRRISKMKPTDALRGKLQ